MSKPELLLQLAEKLRQLKNRYSNPRDLISFTSAPAADDYWYEIFENTIALLEQDIAEIEAALSLCKRVQFEKKRELSLSLIKIRERTKDFLPRIKRQRDYKPKDYLINKYPEDLGIDIARDIISGMLHDNFGDNKFTTCLRNLTDYADELEAASQISAPETTGGKAGDKTEVKPLSERAAMVYKLLKTLPEHEGLTGRKIIEKLSKQNIFIDQSTLTKNIIPILKKDYGVKNQPRIGYYIEK